MSIQLTGADIVDLAVQTETRGEGFYRQAAALAATPQAKGLFEYLANEEVRHKQLFSGLGNIIVVSELDPTTWADAVDYITSTVDREFFQPGAPIRVIPQGATLDEMLGQAIAFEQQTLLFFYTLRDLTHSANRAIIEQIIVEEKSHIRKLASMRSSAGR